MFVFRGTDRIREAHWRRDGLWPKEPLASYTSDEVCNDGSLKSQLIPITVCPVRSIYFGTSRGTRCRAD